MELARDDLLIESLILIDKREGEESGGEGHQSQQQSGGSRGSNLSGPFRIKLISMSSPSNGSEAQQESESIKSTL